MRILDEVKTELERRRIELRSDSTSKACDIYNNVSPRRKAVATQTSSMIKQPFPHPQPFLLTHHLLVPLLPKKAKPASYSKLWAS